MVTSTTDKDAGNDDRLGVIKTQLNNDLAGRYVEAISNYNGQAVQIAGVYKKRL